MLEYHPWSKKTLNETLTLQKMGKFPTLDLELTAKCSGACCIYCDSKPDVCAAGKEGEISFSTLERMLLDAISQGLKWVYTCGLGEPLEDAKYWDMIHLLKAHGVGLSMFSNGVFIRDKYIAKELKEHNVNIILKMDTFNEQKFDTILGRKGTAQKVYAARDLLLEAGYGSKDGIYTNLAFSIVPTSLSIDSIPEVIDFAKSNGIFASIGELEQAGEVINNNLAETLGIKREQVIRLKQVADAYIGDNYMRPICPCILTGLHIDNLGNCVVDEDTGLNCKWFLLKDPRIVKLGNVKEESIFELYDRANMYRQKCIAEKLDLIKSSCAVSYVFGGCGGNPRDIIELYLKEYGQ